MEAHRVDLMPDPERKMDTREEGAVNSSGKEFASWVRAEDFYAHPGLLDRAQEEQITYRPPESKIPYERVSLQGESLPLDQLTQPAESGHPIARIWEAPGANLQDHLNTLSKPFIEFGGPTYDEYWAIEGFQFPQKVLISNIEPGLPMGTGEKRRLVGAVDLQADINKMPLADSSTGAVFISALPIGEQGSREAMRVLEPGGLLFLSSSSTEGLQDAEEAGFHLVRAVFDAHPSDAPHVETDPTTGKPMDLKGNLSFVLVKPNGD
jgi:hypothetical protein